MKNNPYATRRSRAAAPLIFLGLFFQEKNKNEQ
jgi:hypothetical protein